MVGPISVRAAVEALDPEDDAGRGASCREFLARLRWEDGWQGSGPLSVMALAKAVRESSIRNTLHAIASTSPPTTVLEGFTRLNHPVGGGRTRLPARALSFTDAARRVTDGEVVPIRFLSYNTYLLPGVQLPLDRWLDDVVGWDALSWFGIPLGGALLVALGVQSISGLLVVEVLKRAGWTPSRILRTIADIDLDAVRIKPKPALDKRAGEMGRALAGYDVCCLCEVWKTKAADTILADLRSSADGSSWRDARGPGDEGELKIYGSGLQFLSHRFPVKMTEHVVFDDRGDRKHDSDAWTNKGVMLNVLETPVGDLEFYQTHLYYGGGIAEPAGALAAPIGMRDPTEAERVAVWRAELEQIGDFYTRHHRAENVALLTGDFNLDGTDARQYADVRSLTDRLRLRDCWSWDVWRHPPSAGYTCRYTDSEPMELDFAAVCGTAGQSNGSGTFCDDYAPARTMRPGVGRFDYLFIENPRSEHAYRLELARVRRRPFRRQVTTEGQVFLSDHLGLDTTLYLSRR